MNRKIPIILIISLIIISLAGVATASPLDDIQNWANKIKAQVQNNLRPLSISGGSTGMTVTSISPSTTISNDNDLASANFIVNTVADGGGQSVVGTTLTSQTFKSYMSGLTVQYPLHLEVGHISETLRYPIQNQGSLYKFSITHYGRTGWLSSTPAACPSGTTWCFLYLPSPLGANDAYAVNLVSVGSYGRIDNPTIDWSGQATVSINGQAITKTIGSNLGGSVDFSDYNGWVANAKWTGSLVTGQGYPSPANYIATFQPNNNFWSISTFNYYDSYTQSLATEKAALGSVQKSPAGGACYESTCSNIQTIINRHNAVVDTLVSRNDQIGYDAATVVSEKTSGTASSGNVVITLADHRIGIPQITWLVKAAKLGVLIPVGKPEITNIVVNPFASGDSNGVAVVTFRNIGSATGTFSATFTDPTGTFYPTSNTQTARTTVEAGGSGMISVQIGHGSASSAISKTATMTVADVNKPSNMATRDFTISMTVPKACTPGEQRADGLIVSQCRTDGMSWQVILDCNGKTLDYLSGKYSCKDLDKSGLPTVTQTPPTAPCTQNCEEVIDLTPVLWGAILVIFGFMAFTKGWYKNGMFWVGIVILYIIIQTYLIIQGVGSAIEGVLSWRPW